MTFEDEQKQKERSERIQARIDKRIEKLGRKPTALELAEIVNDTLAELSTTTERYKYEMDN